MQRSEFSRLIYEYLNYEYIEIYRMPFMQNLSIIKIVSDTLFCARDTFQVLTLFMLAVQIPVLFVFLIARGK